MTPSGKSHSYNFKNQSVTAIDITGNGYMAVASPTAIKLWTPETLGFPAAPANSRKLQSLGTTTGSSATGAVAHTGNAAVAAAAATASQDVVTQQREQQGPEMEQQGEVLAAALIQHEQQGTAREGAGQQQQQRRQALFAPRPALLVPGAPTLKSLSDDLMDLLESGEGTDVLLQVSLQPPLPLPSAVPYVLEHSQAGTQNGVGERGLWSLHRIDIPSGDWRRHQCITAGELTTTTTITICCAVWRSADCLHN